MVLLPGFSFYYAGYSVWNANIVQLQSRYRSADQTHPEITQPDIPLPIAAQASPDQPQLLDQIQQWIFRGNPVLKAAIAILVIGIILLLRFATEHWQLSLAVKLGLVALSAVVVTGLGYTLIAKTAVLVWHWKAWD